jgi:ABC-type protease/lipase transport system fused ATPase/permease subunit
LRLQIIDANHAGKAMSEVTRFGDLIKLNRKQLQRYPLHLQAWLAINTSASPGQPFN